MEFTTKGINYLSDVLGAQMKDLGAKLEESIRRIFGKLNIDLNDREYIRTHCRWVHHADWINGKQQLYVDNMMVLEFYFKPDGGFVIREAQ